MAVPKPKAPKSPGQCGLLGHEQQISISILISSLTITVAAVVFLAVDVVVVVVGGGGGAVSLLIIK